MTRIFKRRSFIVGLLVLVSVLAACGSLDGSAEPAAAEVPHNDMEPGSVAELPVESATGKEGAEWSVETAKGEEDAKAPEEPGTGEEDAEPDKAPEDLDIEPDPYERESDVIRVQRIPILVYHDITEAAESHNGAIVPRREFESQMEWLAVNGYTTITIEQFLAWQDGGSLPPKPVLITFDDGYMSAATIAGPILENHGFTAVLFVVGDLVGRAGTELQYVDWNDLRAVQASGTFQIGYHSMKGHVFVDGEPALLTWDLDRTITDTEELTAAFLENGISAVPAYAYPYGAFKSETLAAMRHTGMVLAVTTVHGYAVPDSDLLQLPRLIVYPGTTVDQFADLISGSTIAAPESTSP